MTSQADGGNWERQGKGVSWIGFPCQSFRLDADLVWGECLRAWEEPRRVQGGERRRRQGRSILALPLAARQCSPSVIFRPPRFPPSPAPPLPWGIQDSSCCLLGTGKGPKETMLRDSANDGQVERFIPVGCPFPCQAGGGEESTSEAEGRAFPLVCGFLPVPFRPLEAGHSSRRRWARIPV